MHISNWPCSSAWNDERNSTALSTGLFPLNASLGLSVARIHACVPLSPFTEPLQTAVSKVLHTAWCETACPWSHGHSMFPPSHCSSTWTVHSQICFKEVEGGGGLVLAKFFCPSIFIWNLSGHWHMACPGCSLVASWWGLGYHWILGSCCFSLATVKILIFGKSYPSIRTIGLQCP